MKKNLSIFIVMFTAMFLGYLPEAVVADCGKMVIYTYRWHRPPRRPRPPIIYCPPTFPIQTPAPINYGNELTQNQQTTISNANNNAVNINVNSDSGSNTGGSTGSNTGSNTGSVELPPPAPPAPESGGAVAYGDATFAEGEQQAIVAWNGKTDDSGEETLILTTNEISKTGSKMAMLSVLPLPGKPISIERANAKVFVMAKLLLNKKMPSDGASSALGVIMEKKIGSHNIFVWELDNVDAFKDEVTAYVAEKYNNNATALITDNTLKTIKKYFDRGFRYFAFDLTEVGTTPTTKEAISYTFKSKFAYYPLAISAIGGTGRTTVDLIVMTPGLVNLGGAFEQGKEQAKLRLIGNKSVDFSMDELRGLEPKLAKAFESANVNSVKVRNFWIVADDIKKFTDDFTAFPSR
jgi:hypothetical protein